MATLDTIEWPERQPVDLLRDFPWVVGDAPVNAPSTAQAERDVKITALQETSPYAEVFPQAHRVKPTLTPAQIAERRMERLVDKMETAIASTSQPAVVVGHELRIQHGETELDLAAWQSEAAACSSIPTATEKATTSSTSPETVEIIPERIKSRQALPSTSPTASRIKSLREIRQVNRADDDSDGLDLPPREFPQDPWIAEQLDPVELTANLVLDVEAPDDKAADASQRGMAKYSVEMQGRILSTMYATTGLDMWTDPVASQLAAPLNCDAIFGAGTPGDAPPFDTGAIRLPDATALEATWIEQEAKQAFDNAAAHEHAGRPAQAIDALGDGIHAMLGATPAPWGFHYDLSAHKKASTIQRSYHRRYRLRSTAAVQVARVWRGFRTRRRLVEARCRADQSAARLQRWWHRCNRHREAMRLRLQTAMRAKLARLHVNALRQRRLLMRNLRLLVKAWRVQHNSLQALRRKHGYAHFCQLTKERWLSGVMARYRVRKLKRALQAEEAARYAAECAFVDLHLEPKLRDFQRLLKSTRGGAMRLSRLALRLKAEAVARDEARRHWSVADRRRAQIHDVFDTYDVDKSGTIDGNELRHLFDELGIAIDACGLAEALKAMDADGSGSIEFDEFYAWLHAPPPPSSKSRHLKERSALVFLKMKLNVKQFVNRFTDDSFAQHAARLLVFEESQTTQDALRKSFRVTRPPRFACRFCGAPFALYKPFWRHETAECGKNLCRRGASPEEDEVLRITHEQRAVQAALEDVTDAVHAYVATRPGRRALQREIHRVQRLHKQTANATYVSERMKLRDLFLTYDLDDSNTLDEAEFSQISRDLGQPMPAAALSKAFRALDVDGSGKLSFDEFALWAMEQTAKVRKSWTKRLWALLVWWQQRRRQRRAEALRYLIAREKIFAEARARRAFRETFPPPFACPGCQAAFCREEAAATHAKFADAIHARQKDKVAGLYTRIGMTESSTSVLEAAARAVQDMKQMLAVQRYLQTRRGRYALETEVAVLKALREKAKVDPKLYVQGIVRAFAAEKTVLLRDVRHICRLLKRSTASATTTSAIRTLDPSGSGLVVESTLVAWLQDATKARPASRWRAQSPFWPHAKAKCIVAAKYRRYLDAGGIETTDDAATALSLSEDARGSAAVESDMDWLFQEYCQTSAGREALRGEIHRLDNLQAKTTVQARASFIFEQLVNATGKADGGERRLEVEDIAFALRQVSFPFDSRLWLELDPTATGSVALESFQEWYVAVRKQLFETQIPRRNTRRLARALLAVRFQANAAARTNAAADSAHLLVTSKSEEFGNSSLGLPEVKMEVRRIQSLYDRMTHRSSAHLVAMAFDAFGMHGVVDNVDIGAVLYFANCPCDSASIGAIRRDPTAQIVHEDAVLTWLQQQTHGLHRFQRATTSFWRRFHRTDRIERLAKAIVGARQRRRLYQT
ncbi:hypothetical protein AC1031_015685 [Aphanomyces cochlioides]|nr:hypothetical protein AC1031_015685 [Aphanomyces cochlioides]